MTTQKNSDNKDEFTNRDTSSLNTFHNLSHNSNNTAKTNLNNSFSNNTLLTQPSNNMPEYGQEIVNDKSDINENALVDESTNTNPQSSNQQLNTETADDLTLVSATQDSLVLNHLLSDNTTPWQIFNCKISEKTVTQDKPLPFIYYYDNLADDIKVTHPLTPDLLKQFQTNMTAEQAAKLLNIEAGLITKPWQVKILGTLVMYCERLQLAIRLKFTNTAKALEPIYSHSSKDAAQAAMKNWHFYGDVFVLNKNPQPIFVVTNDDAIAIEKNSDYQKLPAKYTISVLSELEKHKEAIPIIEEAIQARLD